MIYMLKLLGDARTSMVTKYVVLDLSFLESTGQLGERIRIAAAVSMMMVSSITQELLLVKDN